MTTTDLPTFDCLVLSGGGAKGAYGAGAARALFKYRAWKRDVRKEPDRRLCLVGTSVGALNASILAASAPASDPLQPSTRLIELWRSLSNARVLGARIDSVKYHAVKAFCTRRHPYSIYGNKALSSLLGEYIDETHYAKLVGAELIIAATNYTTGVLAAFHLSPLVREFCTVDAARPDEDQRLRHFIPIMDVGALRGALLASAAIPPFFPPVKLSIPTEPHGRCDSSGKPKEQWFVDGGIGNNTATREAAYFLRFLEDTGKGKAGVVYCVRQDPIRSIQDGDESLQCLDVINRSFEVYHRIHTASVVAGWHQINRGEERHLEREAAFKSYVDSLSLPTSVRDRLHREVEKLRSSRKSIPIVTIEPSIDLGNLLKFTPDSINANMKAGHGDMLSALFKRGEFSDVVLAKLSNDLELSRS